MKLSRLAIAAYITVVFLCGVILGAFSFRLYTVSTVSAKSPQTPQNPEQFRKNYLATMQSRLKLTGDQVTQLNLILDDTRARIREVHDRHQPEIQQIRKEQTDKIRALLSTDQRSTYEEMLKQREQRLKEKGGRPGPGF